MQKFDGKNFHECNRPRSPQKERCNLSENRTNSSMTEFVKLCSDFSTLPMLNVFWELSVMVLINSFHLIYLQMDLSKNAKTHSKRKEVKFNLYVSLLNYSATQKLHSFNSIFSDWTENELIALKRN